MESRKIFYYWIIRIFLPNILLASYVFLALFYFENLSLRTYFIIFGGMLVYFVLRLYYYYYKIGFTLWNNLQGINQIIGEFKRGKFIINEPHVKGPILPGLSRDLVTVGKHFDSILRSQNEEIKKFNELYSHIISSMNSYFMILDTKNNIVYVNEVFLNKFNAGTGEVLGKNITDVFYFLNVRLKKAISQLRDDPAHSFISVKNVHLMSLNRDSIIVDLKLSHVMLNGNERVVIIMDDITDRFSKDYHTSMLSHLTEFIGSDAETDKIYYNILFGVTSGAGLGFNRAMLFLVEDDELVGKIAVGPDSFEEAIEVWNSVPASEIDLNLDYPVDIRSNAFLNRVKQYSKKLKEDNIFIQSLKQMTKIHVVNAAADNRLDDETREFMEVNEFIIMPLISFNKAIGLIVADNKFNMTGISSQNIDLLSIFSFQAASLIESYLNFIDVKFEMKKLEERQEALVESEKMAAVGRIASHIAHEIRNPLVTMGGYAKRIIRNSEEEVNRKKVRQSAEIILNESERLEKILSNVMDFTRPSAYIKEFNNMNNVIQDTFLLLKNVISDKRLRVKLNLKKDLPNVKSDLNQMKQVILNLIQNSMDATPEGGKIEISTQSDAKNVIITVSDEGHGIHENDPNIIFEPFFTTKITGVGLGLANVKKIIKDHRGKISVVNREEGGVEFTIKIPLPVNHGYSE